jgi:hypothetical protein
MLIKGDARGKRYKDWLFARVNGSADDPIDVIQGGATLIIRDAVREYLRRECPMPDALSLDMPLSGDEGRGAVTFVDVLAAKPDPSFDVCLREHVRLAEGHARAWLGDVTVRERIALAAKALGLSLAHPGVVALSDCTKSSLNRAYHEFLRRTADRLSTEYAGDDKESVLSLALLVVRSISALILEQKKWEELVSQLFRLVEVKRQTEHTKTLSGLRTA